MDVLVEAGVEPALAENVWREIWQASKTAPELARHRDVSAAAHRAVWTALFSRAEPHAAGITEVLYERVLRPQRWQPYPDATPVLREVHRRRLRVGVVSNIPEPLEPAFRRHDLHTTSTATRSPTCTDAKKPDPELFRLACREVWVEPAAALMVGDSHLTDGGAVAAGLTTLLLPSVPPGATRGLAQVVALLR